MANRWGRLLRTLSWLLQGQPPADSMAEAVTKLVDAVCCIIHDGSPLRAEDQSGFYTGYLFTVLKVSALHWPSLASAALSSTAVPCASRLKLMASVGCTLRQSAAHTQVVTNSICPAESAKHDILACILCSNLDSSKSPSL